MKTGIELIAQERKEQIEKHGRTVKMDVDNNSGRVMAEAANALLIGNDDDFVKRQKSMPDEWNRYDSTLCRKMCQKSYMERLIIAGALIAAEIDRLNYSELSKSTPAE